MAYQPKSYRKFIATAATATLVASAVTPAAAATSFTDVATKYQDAVNYLVDNNITKGMSETKFGTYENIKRGDAAVWLAAALGLDTANAADQGFTDLNSRVAGSVNALKAAGYINGKSETKFAPDAFITRGEMALILARAYNLSGTTDKTFTDVSSTYKAAVDALVSNEISQGATATTFGTTSPIQRGDFAIFLHRAETLAPEVVSVSAVSAKRVEIKFNQPVASSSLFADANGNFKANTVSLTSIDSVPADPITGSLSADGKTLTVITTNAVSKRYDVLVQNLLTTSGEAVAKYQQVVSLAADTVAPSIVSTTKPTAGTVKVVFSEPMNTLGTVTFKKADGTIVTAGGTGISDNFTVGAKEVTFTLGSDVAANTSVTATFVGAQDQAGNLISPNPSTVSLYKGVADGVAPTVSSITQTGATEFAVTFSEELQTTPTVTVNNAATVVEKDSTNPMKFIVTTTSPLDGASTVAISNFTDLSGVAGTPISRVVTFVKDTAAPKVTSSAVVADSVNGKQYLELTFDKDVTLSGATVDATSGSYVKDYITTTLDNADITAQSLTYKNVSSSKKVVRVELDTFLGTTHDVNGATYTLNLAFTGVTSSSQVAASVTSVTFTRGQDGAAANTALVAVSSFVQGSDNNKVNVTFDKAVDGASATNVANYQIDGAIVESVTLLPASGGTQVAVLNLKASSNGFTGVRNYSVTNVKALGSSKVMNPHYGTVSLNENIAPYITSAKLTATNQVTITVSEFVDATADSNDFELYIGGVKVAANDVVATGSATDATTLVLTLEDDVTAANISSGLTLKALSTIDIVDNAGNKLSVPTAGITISQ